MAEIADVADINAVHFHEIDGVFAFFLAFDAVMISSDAEDEDAGNFIFAGAFDNMSAGHSLSVRMGGVRVAYGNDIRRLFAEGITG